MAAPDGASFKRANPDTVSDETSHSASYSSAVALWFGCALLWASVPGTAWGLTGSSKDTDCWVGRAGESDVNELAERFRLSLPCDGFIGFSAADLHAMVVGARSFPTSLVGTDDPVIRFRFRDAERPFGMGDGTDEWPDLDISDPADWTFTLYRFSPSAEDRAEYRLERLSADQKRRLWLGRTVVHALARRMDIRLRWSTRPDWYLLNLWEEPSDSQDESVEPGNIDPRGYSRMLGMDSPHLDLVTFLEEYLIGPEDLGPGLVPPDDSLFCQEFSKIRFVQDSIRQNAPQWERNFPHQRPECALFEKWLNWEEVDGVEVVLAAASTVQVESIFGHMFLRIAPYDRRRGPSFEKWWQFQAIIGDDEANLWYLLKGLTGRFTTVLVPSTLSQITADTIVGEHRSLQRYRFNFDRPQLRRFLERVWEMERRHAYDYYFLTGNCASFVVDAVRSALGGEVSVGSSSGLADIPSNIIELLANVQLPGSTRVDATKSRPLLSYQPPDIYSDEETASLAETELEILEERIRALLGGVLADEFRSLKKETRDSDPTVRKQAYLALGTWISRTLKEQTFGTEGTADELRWSLTRSLTLLVRIERLALNLAKQRAQKTRVVVRKRRVHVTTTQILQMRRDLYRRELPEDERLDRVADLMRRINEEVKKDPTRALTESETESLRLEDLTLQAFAALTGVVGDAIVTFDPQFDAVGSQEAELSALGRTASSRQSLTVGGAGAWRAGVGMGAIASWSGSGRLEGGATEGLLSLGMAAFDQQLGDQSRYGFLPDLELVLLKARSDFVFTSGMFDYHSTEGTVFSLKTLRRKVGAVRRTALDNFGWGFSIDAANQPARAVDFLSRGRIGLDACLLCRPHLLEFLTAGVGAEFDAVVGADKVDLLTGAGVELRGQLHIFGRHCNLLRFRVTYSPLVTIDGWTLKHAVEGSMDLRFLLAEPAGQPLLLGVAASADYTPLTCREAEDRYMEITGLVSLWY